MTAKRTLFALVRRDKYVLPVTYVSARNLYCSFCTYPRQIKYIPEVRSDCDLCARLCTSMNATCSLTSNIFINLGQIFHNIKREGRM